METLTKCQEICNAFIDEVQTVPGLDGWGRAFKSPAGDWRVASSPDTIPVMVVQPADDGTNCLYILTPFHADHFTFGDAMESIRWFARKYAACVILLEG